MGDFLAARVLTLFCSPTAVSDPYSTATFAIQKYAMNQANKSMMKIIFQDHFDETQYKKMRVDGRQQLKSNAVPTVFAFTPAEKR